MPNQSKKVTCEEREKYLDKCIETETLRIQKAERTLARLGHVSGQQRKQRTRRLIQLGAELEAWTKQEMEPQILAEVLDSVVNRRNGQRLGELLSQLYRQKKGDS